MDAQSTASLRITTLRPKYVEIMNRLICGQPSKVIAEEMNISPGRLSIIINSPLFKMELRRRMLQKEMLLMEMEEEMISAAKLGLQVHKEILDSKAGTYPTEVKLKSATTMVNLGARLLVPKSFRANDRDDGNGEGYEERLKEVTIRERVRTHLPPQENPQQLPDEISSTLNQNYPDDEDLSSSLLTPEEEELESYQNALLEGEREEDTFTPTKKISEIIETLAKKEEKG